MEVETYLEAAKRKELQITHIFETHSQADHLSGNRKLAELTGAKIYLHQSAKANFPFVPLKDGDLVEIGNVQIKLLHTPGHTPDSVCYLVSDCTRGSEPWFVLTGDTLLVGDAGRPDLEGDAAQLYDSIFNKLLKLEEAVEIFPGHYSGSVCGRGLSSKPSSTIGFEKKFNLATQYGSKGEFIKKLTENLPPQPPDFQLIRKKNLGMG